MTSSGQETRLVWIEWYFDESGERKANYSLSENHLSPEIVSSIEGVISGLCEMRTVLIFYEVFRRNYNDLVAAYDQIENMLHDNTFSNVDITNIQAHGLLQQRVTNFLNSASLMLERTKSEMKCLEPKVFNLEDAKAAESKAYDTFKSYSLCQELRNFSQHVNLPINSVSIDGRANTSQWDFDLQLMLNSDHFSGAKKKLRDLVVKNYDEEILLRQELSDYFNICGEVFLFMIKPLGNRLARAISLRKETLERKPENMPNAEPLLWRGALPNRDGSGEMSTTSFSFLEIEFWGKTLKSISSDCPDFLGVSPSTKSPS